MENTINLISNHIGEMNFSSYHMICQEMMTKNILALGTTWAIQSEIPLSQATWI